MTPEEKLFLKYEKARVFIVGFTPPEFKLLKAYLYGKHITGVTESRDAETALDKLELASFHLFFINVDLHNNHTLLEQVVETTRFANTPIFVFSKTPMVYQYSYEKRRMKGVFCRLPVNINEVEKYLLALMKEGKIEKSQIGALAGVLQHYALGCKAMEQGNLAEAKEQLRLALKEDPKFFDGYLKMAEVLTGQEDYDTALRVLAKANEIQPNDARVFFKMGMVQLAKGDKTAAVDLCKKAIALDPRNIKLIMDCGNAFLEKNHIEEALYFFNMAKGQSPDFIYAYNRIGIALSRAGRFGEAEESYNHALKLDENDPGIYFNLGMMWMRQQKNDKAAEKFKQALVLDPEMNEAREMMDKITKGEQPAAKA
ncbi:MAG: tetratricopeptide repeat protein [Nitrospinae bacterium]|nr:tetratricopeptide repeat protein [Nitrospinota bacterium]